MARLLLLIAIAFTLWYWWQKGRALAPEQRANFYWKSAFWAILITALLLVASGRMHWVGAAFAALLPLFKSALVLGLRALPVLKMVAKMKTTPSRFATPFLNMEINFSRGTMDGEVMQGEFRGQHLSAMDESQLNKLAQWLKEQHTESFLLLQAYLVRAGHGSSQQQQQQQQQQSWAGLSDNEALQILGLQPGAEKQEIVHAHRRLIQKLHPDRGGSDYLAAKINAAKEQLLKGDS